MLKISHLRNIFAGAANARLVSTGRIMQSDMIDVPDRSLPIPTYEPKQNETTKVKRARLLYQSRKRGMLENGILLSTFAGEYLSNMDEKQLDLYDKLINQVSNDWDIFYFATNVKPTPPEYDNEIMNLLKKHVKNEGKEKRYSQPNLVFE